jgi:hypothetical protein
MATKWFSDSLLSYPSLLYVSTADALEKHEGPVAPALLFDGAENR